MFLQHFHFDRFGAALLVATTLAIGSGNAWSADATAAPQAAQDEVLEALIGTAIASNPALRAKRSSVDAARHDVEAARWQYAPTVSTQLQRGTGAATQYGSTLRVDQRLYTGGRLNADLDAASSRRDGSLLEVQESALTVAQQVVAAYQSLQAAQAQQQAIGAYRERLEGLNASISRRIDNGVSPQSDMALMSARQAQSANELASARASTSSALATLRRLAGTTSVQSSAALPAGAAAPAPLLCADDEQGDAARNAALDRHPSLRRAQQDVESARFALESQRAAMKPTLTLRVEQPVGPVPANTSNNARVALVFEYSSEAGLSASSRVDAGGQRLAALGQQALAQRREVEQQIRTECADYTSTAQRVTGFAQARGFTTDVLASYTRLFVAGRRSWLEVLNAAREDFDNEQAGLVATAALQAARYRLALLSGDYALGQPEPEGAADRPLPALSSLSSLFSWARK